MKFVRARLGAPAAQLPVSPISGGHGWKERSGFWHEFARAEFLPPSVRCLDHPDQHRPPVKALTNGPFACEAGHRSGPPL